MSEPRHIAPIRFGHGLRLGETPPTDPVAWLEHQLATADRPGGGATSARAVQARAETITQRQARDRAGAAAIQGGMPRSMVEAELEAPGRTPLGLLTRNEMFRWARQRLASDTPFRDRLADFWMNHFTVSRRNGPIGALPATLEREAIRPHLTGSFADMLVAVTVAFLVGGAVAGGRVAGDFPGLSGDALFEDRDLRPTTDLRSIAKALLRDHLRLEPHAVAQAFPDSAAVPAMQGMLRS